MPTTIFGITKNITRARTNDTPPLKPRLLLALKSTPNWLRCVDIPLREHEGWISYRNLARVIAIAGAKGMSLEDFIGEAASDLIGFGESPEELKNWTCDHLADICREAQLLTDGRFTSDKYFWTLIHNLVDEAEARNNHVQ